MDSERTDAWLALSDAGLPPATLRRLLDAFDRDPAHAMRQTRGTWRDAAGLKASQCERLGDCRDDAIRLRRQREVLDESGIRIVEATAAEYPARLAELPDAPPCLYVRGELRPEDRLAIGVVGPRLATPYGLEMARRLSGQLAEHFTIVSGLAVGIDSSAHENAVRAGGRTVGVAACGLDQDYPKGTSKVRDGVLSSGAIVSVYPPLTKPATHHFPARNHLLASLCLGVVIIEASEKSGALATARAAADLGREVFAVPGDATRRSSHGTNQLIREGAVLTTCVGDVIEALAPQLSTDLEALRALEPGPDEVPAEEDTSLSPAQRAVYAVVCRDRVGYDDLVSQLVPASLNLGEVTTALLQLEIAGKVRQLPGKVYVSVESGRRS